MIETFNRINRNEQFALLEFLNNNFNHDFYYTLNNARIYVTDIKSLKTLIKESDNIYILKERGDYVGVILIWKSIGGGKTRYYVKINALNSKIAKNLITVLLWNVNKDLYAKLRKDSVFLSAFKYKGFKFRGGRGIQILLNRKNRIEKLSVNKEDN